MTNDFIYCPKCGSKKIENKANRKWFCPECGFDLYNNVAAAVGVIIFDKDFNILLEKRAKNPRKDYLALPGGFVDPDETAEEAVIRECKEEIGAEIKDIKFLCTFPNTYEYKNIVYKTCDMFFTAKLPESKTVEELIRELKIQESEVQNLVAVKVEDLAAVEKIPLAFESAVKTLQKWVKER